MAAGHVIGDCMASSSPEGPLIDPFTPVIRIEPDLWDARLLASSALGHGCVFFICTFAVVFFCLLLRSGAIRLG